MVAFKLICAISKKMNLDEKYPEKFIDYVSIATIADVVPLVSENRYIVKKGLERLPKTKFVGIRKIIENSKFKIFDSYSIAFGICPRINACGRLGVQYIPLKLLITDDNKKASELALKLEACNIQRKKIEKEIYDLSEEKIEKNNDNENNIIIEANDGWHSRSYRNSFI